MMSAVLPLSLTLRRGDVTVSPCLPVSVLSAPGNQQMRGSCSPLSMSTMRQPPMRLRIVTVPPP